MRILDRYLLKELTATFVAVLLVLLLITFGTEATKLLAMAVSGQLPSNVVAKVLLLKIPPALEVILPLVTLLSVMLAFGRLYQDQEMVVLNSCGIGPHYFQKRVFWFLLPIALLTAWVTLWLTPWSFQTEQKIIREAQEQTPVAGLVAGKFNSLPNGQGVFYAREISTDGAFKNAWIQLKQASQNGKPSQMLIMVAPEGRFEWKNGQLALVLLHGQSYQGLGQSATLAPNARQEVVVQKFGRFEGILPQIQLAPERLSKWAQPTAVLWHSDQPHLQALLAWRLVIPFGLIVLGLLGLKLSKTGPREGRFAKVFIAIVLYVIYNQLLVTERDLVAEGKLPWEWGLLPVPLLYLWYALYQPPRRHNRKWHQAQKAEGVA